MKIARIILVTIVALASIVLSCVGNVPAPIACFEDVPPSTCDEIKTVHKDFHGDPAFTDAERRAIVQGMSEWSDFSQGHVAFTVAFDYAGQDGPRIRKVAADDQRTKAFEAAQEDQPFTVNAWTTADDEVNLVVERVPFEQLHTLAAHELGHAAGLRWPWCFSKPHQECIHSPDPKAVMARTFSGAPAFTPSDLLFCRESCLCP